jgi:hypothetical protein
MTRYQLIIKTRHGWFVEGVYASMTEAKIRWLEVSETVIGLLAHKVQAIKSE